MVESPQIIMSLFISGRSLDKLLSVSNMNTEA